MNTTTVKHLYKAAAQRNSKLHRAAAYDFISHMHGIPLERVYNMPVSELLALLKERGDISNATELVSMNALNLWAKYGCQTFVLDEKTVDLLACTAAPDLSELVTMSKESSTDVERAKQDMDLWKLPYPAFAIQLPYPTSVDMNGTTEYFTAAVVTPFANLDNKGNPDWSLTYLTVEDVATKKISASNGSSALGGLLTNLCAYLGSGDTTVKRAPKKIGYDKIAKKCGTKVNRWNVLTTSITDLPVGVAKQFLSSGQVPPKTFRIGKRFMVRGHWRNQPCGPGRQDRKRKWITPHMKGPEDGEAFSRVYSVAKKEEQHGTKS